MELNLKDKLFLICGATSGFGRATAESLLAEGARVIAIARHREKLDELREKYKNRVVPFQGNITDIKFIDELISEPIIKEISGVFVNAGGPPAMGFDETTLSDWDSAYKNLVRWKYYLTSKLIPVFRKKQNGRLIYVESSAVKQPIENLVLSNSMRMAVVGMVKSLALELAEEGITLNILAPGYHETQAVERIIKKRSEDRGMSYAEAKSGITSGIPMGRMGKPADFGSLATWLFSEHSSYITGQTISVDGGVIRYVFG